jgi:hypothetical protein
MHRGARSAARAAIFFGSITIFSGGCGEEPRSADQPGNADDAIVAQPRPLLSTISLKPTSDVVKTSVSGVGNTTSLHLNVDDGIVFSSADDSSTYVRTTAATGIHRAGYSGGSAGVVKQVVVSHRARSVTSTGTSQVKLYSGGTLVGSGAVRSLPDTWGNFTDTFANLSLADVNNLRTEVVLKRTSGTGHLRYTLVWIVATVESGPSDTTPPIRPWRASSSWWTTSCASRTRARPTPSSGTHSTRPSTAAPTAATS